MTSTTTRTTRTGTAAMLAVLALMAAPTAGAAPSDDGKRTRLTLEVADCEGCELTLHQGIERADGTVDRWRSRSRQVEDGSVTFDVRRSRTRGMSITVEAPWEGHTGYLTTVAMRYAGKETGDAVTLAQARRKERASACWEGSRSRAVTLPVTVEKVRVQGVRKKVDGSIAFLEETSSWLAPMREARHGVLGSQDIDVCR